MYLLLLLLVAFFLISIMGVNWPLKLYHHYLLCKLADALGVAIEKNSIFSNVYSQINTVYHGQNLKIRFVDGSVDSIKANPGLEIRVRKPGQFLMEFYHFGRNKREWGDFKRFLTGDKITDAEWFILTDNPEMATDLWREKGDPLKNLLNSHGLINQILFSKQEIIIQLRRFHSCREIVSLLDQVSKVFEP